ncbi:RNA-directed DNA polymerase, eukaryota, reverse transcriptase zinc-binding domain protein [Tanacetum coccineum]
MARQSVLVKVETRDGNIKMYGTFIYTSNSGLERKELWKDLEIYKRIVGNEPWFLSGDLNVTLTPKEYSMGSSTMSCDIKDFQRCVNIIEVEDVNSSGLFYTWTKNLDKIKKGGGIEEGCRMFKTIKSLKGLKKHLKQLAWRNGNIFENVNKLRDSVKEIQKKIDKDPNNHELRCEEEEVLKLYSEAIKDEEKFLFQKAKIKFEGKDVADQFVKHFQQFLGESRHVEQISDMGSLFKKKLNSIEAEYMVREVSNEEIKVVMFQIDDNKAPGPDVKEFFETGKILRKINSIIIALVLKMLKGCLDKLISKNQSAFIPNRHIQDNIMLAQELFKGYDRKMGPKRVAVKVDIQKAYDTVNWQFLESILNRFGLHYKMVQWIMRCVSTSSFSICINGQSYRYFKGGRGLRQGDSISPYLFTLVMEILTLIIKMKVDQNRDFQYHFGCKKLKITNVCFADDLLMFCHADKSSMSVLKDSIDEFGKVENLPIKYLGVPLTSKRLRAKECKSLLDKVEMFLLPVGVIKDINKLLKNFLWQQNDGSKGRAKDKVICKIGVDWKEDNWSNNVESFAKKRNVNSINSIIRRICLDASVYLIWQERNNRIFRDELRSPDELHKTLEDIIRMRLLSLKVKNSTAVKKAQEV